MKEAANLNAGDPCVGGNVDEEKLSVRAVRLWCCCSEGGGDW